MNVQIRHLLAQTPHSVIHDSVTAVVIRFPDLFQNLFTRKGSTGVLYKHHQEFIFFRGKIDRRSCRIGYRAFDIVDAVAVNRDCFIVIAVCAPHGAGMPYLR